MRGWLRKKLVPPILDQLRRGITPEKIALSLALGIGLGVFPVLGTTVILCTMASVIFGLNLPSIQLVNCLVYPLQLALLVPFVRLGEVLFRAPRVPLSLPLLMAMLRADLWATVKIFWMTSVHAITAWLLVGPLAIYLLYLILCPPIRALTKRRNASNDAIAAKVS